MAYLADFLRVECCIFKSVFFLKLTVAYLGFFGSVCGWLWDFPFLICLKIG
jgi:hypothetical protein